MAEEYKHCALCYIQSPCEYQNENAILQDDWIPCSDSVPKERNMYLVTYESGGIGIMEYITEKDWFTKRELGWNGMYGDNRVIAWQTLPPAFKPKGE